MSKTEKMTERVTVKMDANLKAKLMREAERCGGVLEKDQIEITKDIQAPSQKRSLYVFRI